MMDFCWSKIMAGLIKQDSSKAISQKTTSIQNQLNKISVKLNQLKNYTPQKILELLQKELNPELFLKSLKLIQNAIQRIKILDPTCGDGVFLLEAVNQKQQWLEEIVHLNLDPERIPGKPGSELIIKNIFGYDIDEYAVLTTQFRLCLFQINSLLKHYSNLSLPALIIKFNQYSLAHQIQHLDALQSQNTDHSSYDLIIGNPPYVNLIEQKDVRTRLEQDFPEIYHGKLDLCYYFIPLGLKLASKNTIIGFVLKRYFLKSSVARELRRFLKKYAIIQEIIDFGNIKMFQNVGIETLIMTFTRSEGANRSSKTTQYRMIQKPSESQGFLEETFPPV